MAYNPQNPNGQATMANSAPVVIASDQSEVSVKQQASAGGGVSVASGTIGATATAVSATAGQVYGWYIYNPNSVVAYVQFFNTAAGSVTPGSTTPVYSIGIPATSGANVFGIGVAHSTAITIAITTGRSNGISPSSTVDYNIFYKN